MDAGKIVINAIPENKEVREMCQLNLDLDEVNNINVTHVLNTEHQNVIKNLA